MNRPAIELFQYRTLARSSAMLALLFAFCVIVPGCQKPPAESTSAETAPAEVEVATVVKGSLDETIELPYSIEGYEQAKLFSRIEGYVQKIAVNIGDEVSKRQELVTLDVPELAAEVERRRQMVAQAEAMVITRQTELKQTRSQLVESEANQALAKSKIDMVRSLVDGGALNSDRLAEAEFSIRSAAASVQRAQADIEAAAARIQSSETAVKVARSELDKAEAEASYTTISAPFDGLITQRGIDPGALVRPEGGKGTMPLLTIASVNRVRAVVFIPIQHADRLDNGDRVKFPGSKASNNQNDKATITRHAKAFQSGSRMMRAEVDLENPLLEGSSSRQFKAGDYGRLHLTLQTVTGPTIPMTALIEDGKRKSVMVIDSDNKCTKHDVTIAHEGEKAVVLASGLKVGERVIATNPKNVKDGQTLSDDSIKAAMVEIQ